MKNEQIFFYRSEDGKNGEKKVTWPTLSLKLAAFLEQKTGQRSALYSQ